VINFVVSISLTQNDAILRHSASWFGFAALQTMTPSCLCGGGCFQPVMQAHGSRMHNEVWSYGKQAEPILAKYLKLRYQLLPYTYSVA
jgi:Glycosyl hydrolases family 31